MIDTESKLEQTILDSLMVPKSVDEATYGSSKVMYDLASSHFDEIRKVVQQHLN